MIRTEPLNHNPSDHPHLVNKVTGAESLHLEDEQVLKTLLQYSFADTPTFEDLTETERAIIGDRERFERFVTWACEGKPNPYAG